ncbi:AAA family ATPase [Maridesulfovibrio sp.]|uniref:AAA family ATPase n=1 Tax=Maridesulfovibrio sp. TaxID=2795000 RepID=UPI0039EFD03B
MQNRLDRITIKGFKSIKNLEDFKLNNLNVLIGGNGSGKSNFIDFFRMIRVAMGHEIPDVGTNLETFFEMHGRISNLLFNGSKVTDEILAGLTVDGEEQSFSIKPGYDERPVVQTNNGQAASGALLGAFLGGILGGSKGAATGALLGAGLSGNGRSQQSSSENQQCEVGTSGEIRLSGGAIAPYHFHDTERKAKKRQYEIIQDSAYLRLDASNIAPFLLNLKTEFPNSYEDIVETVQTVTPFFDDFNLNIKKTADREEVRLDWRQVNSDFPMQPYHLSDGTLRFICLATALLQPCPPGIIIIDEPELGLHPFALGILAELIQDASTRSQIIIATQSTELVNYFSPEDVVVVNRKGGASTFNRLDSDDLGLWLEDYSLGQLWQKNVIAGGPDYE